MNRRSLALGAAVILPAGFAALHAQASTPPLPPRHDADAAIRRAHRAFFAAVATEARICAASSAHFDAPEEEAQTTALTAAIHQECEAVEAVACLSARTLAGLRLKAAILTEALAQAEDFALDTSSRQVRLAASVAEDIARLFPAGGGHA